MLVPGIFREGFYRVRAETQGFSVLRSYDYEVVCLIWKPNCNCL